MDTREIKDICKRIERMVDERDDDAFSWEDAIKECGLSEEDGLVILAILHAAHGLTSRHLKGKIDAFFATELR